MGSMLRWLLAHMVCSYELYLTLQAMNPKRHRVLVQCVALKMLTDFTLMYSSCVGLLLKRDGELAARDAGISLKTPSKNSSAPTGTLFR